MAQKHLITLIFGLLIGLFASPVYAQNIKIKSISRSSAHTIDKDGKAVIYGGISGPECGAKGSSEMCNSCLDPDFSCNLKRIHRNLALKINFEVTGDVTPGKILVGYKDGSSIYDLSYDNNEFDRSTDSDIGKGSSGSVTIRWGILCDVADEVEDTSDTCTSMALGGDGDGSASYTLLIGIGDIEESGQVVEAKINIVEPTFEDLDLGPHFYGETSSSSDAGFFHMRAAPGDDKIYITDIKVTSNCPSTGSSTVKSFRFFYSQDSLSDANYDNPNFKDFDIDEDCEPTEDFIIDGLQNGLYYYVRGAIVDKAENVAFLVNYDQDLAGRGDTIVDVYGTDCDPAPDPGKDAACPYLAQPDNVLGLLTEDYNCFIATVAFDGGFRKPVQILRHFRDRILRPTSFGKSFIEWYYENGPQAAKWISDKPVAKQMVRVALLPVTAAAWFTLHYGIWGTTLVGLIIIGFLLAQTKKIRAERIRVKQQRGNEPKN